MPERAEGIDIERCAHCDGVWLDPGEYDAVRHRIERKEPGIEPRAKSDKGKGFPAGVGDGVEIVLALIEFLL